jgi:hypothetical protein
LVEERLLVHPTRIVRLTVELRRLRDGDIVPAQDSASIATHLRIRQP